MSGIPARFPKVQAPYERSDNENGDYTVDPEVMDGYEWVFDRAEEVDAVEKLHGTNIAVKLEHGDVVDAATRMGNREMNELNPFADDANHHYITRGVQNSIRRGYLYKWNNGWLFGELVGPKFHGNPYELDEHLFIPFDWLREHCSYNSYGEYSTEFDAISDWFKEGLFSLFYSRIHGTSLDDARVSNGVFVEGVVFVHPDFHGRIKTDNLDTYSTASYDAVASELAKLRRDMYDWYDAESNN